MTSNLGPSIIQSPNTPLLFGTQLLFYLPNANLRITTDQKFRRVFSGRTWDPWWITAVWRSGAYNSACLGGIFSAPSKGGSAIVAVGQSYSALTGDLTHQHLTVQASSVTFTQDPYFSLSTANGAALTADLYIYGFCYDPIS